MHCGERNCITDNVESKGVLIYFHALRDQVNAVVINIRADTRKRLTHGCGQETCKGKMTLQRKKFSVFHFCRLLRFHFLLISLYTVSICIIPTDYAIHHKILVDCDAA